MKRIAILLLALVLCAGFVFAAGSTEADASKSNEKVTIRWWQRNSGAGGPLYEYFKAFNESQNEIEVVYEGYGENYKNMLNLALNSDDPPDVFEISSSDAPVCDFAKAGYIVSIDDILTDEFKSQFNSSAFTMKSFQLDGKIFCIPLRLQHYKLLYNTEIFAECGLAHAPETLEELREYAKIITEKGKGKYYGIGFYGNYGKTWFRYVDMANIARGKSGTYGFDYEKGRYDFSNQKDMLEFWINVAKDGSMFPGAMTIGVEQMRAYFAQGNVAMIIDGNWMSTQFATNIKTDVKWDAAPIPIFAGEKRAKDYMYCDVAFAIAANGKNIDTAKKVYSNVLTHQTEFRSFGEADTKTFSAANTDEIMATLPSKYVYQGLPEVNNVKNNSCFAVEPDRMIALEGDSRDAVLNALFVAALDGKKIDIDGAMADLTKRYNAALDKALANGNLTKEDVQPAGFDYFTR